MRRVLINVVLLVMGVLCLAYIFVPAKTVEFSQEEIDEVVNNLLPYEIESGVVTIVVRTATLKFRSGNKVGVETTFDAEGLTLEGVGAANIETSIRYEGGSFYLSNLVKENIQFEFSQNSRATISDISSSIISILKREEDEAAENGDGNKAESVEKFREYSSTKLQTDAEDALDDFLKSIPIYNLSGQGGKLWLAALALESVKISEGKVTAVLSYQILIIRVASAVLSALLIAAFIFGPFGVSTWLSNLRGSDSSTPK